MFATRRGKPISPNNVLENSPEKWDTTPSSPFWRSRRDSCVRVMWRPVQDVSLPAAAQRSIELHQRK
jgi:hypothetical protein